MSLSTNITDVVTAIATKIKQTRTWVNGNAADLSGLTTTNKTNLVAAINEVKASVASAAGINDATTATSSTWSSSKVSAEIAAASTADRARGNHTGTQSADTVVDGTTNKVFTATEKTKLAGVAAGATVNATDAALRARSSHTGTQPMSSISDAQAYVDGRISAWVGSAPAAMDTLSEIAALITENVSAIDALEAIGAGAVRFDADQTALLTAPQKTAARANIGAADAAALSSLVTNVGDTNANYVTTFEAGLV